MLCVTVIGSENVWSYVTNEENSCLMYIFSWIMYHNMDEITLTWKEMASFLEDEIYPLATQLASFDRSL